MKRANYECKDCEHKFVFAAEYGQDFPVNPECPECHSLNTQRYWSVDSIPACQVAEGKTGNARNGYKSNVLYKPASATPTKTAKRNIDGPAWDG